MDSASSAVERLININIKEVAMNNMDRRSFLCLGAGALALPSIASSAGACADRMRKGEWTPLVEGPMSAPTSPVLKKVKFTKIEIGVGAEKPFRAIHCSDSHVAYMTVNDLLSGNNNLELAMFSKRLLQKPDALPSLAACVLKARRERIPLFHTGDLYDYESAANISVVDDAFKGVGECLYAVGNHEYHGHWRNGIKGAEIPPARARLNAAMPHDLTFASRIIGGVNFIAFDNGGFSYELADLQFESMKKEFAKGLSTVVMCHLPLWIEEAGKDRFEGAGPYKGHKPPLKDKSRLSGLFYGYGNDPKAKRLVNWLKKQKNLKAVLCGHHHTECSYRFSETATQYMAGATYMGNAYEITFV